VSERSRQDAEEERIEETVAQPEASPDVLVRTSNDPHPAASPGLVVRTSNDPHPAASPGLHPAASPGLVVSSVERATPGGEEARERPSLLDMLFREAEVIARNLKESGTRR
jgi:hypothetical protein